MFINIETEKPSRRKNQSPPPEATRPSKRTEGQLRECTKWRRNRSQSCMRLATSVTCSLHADWILSSGGRGFQSLWVLI